MADSDRMEKIDMKTQFNSMSSTDKHFIKKAEEFAMARGMSQKNLRKKNMILAAGLFVGIFGIYTYSLSAVKQENFLDEYDDMHKK